MIYKKYIFLKKYLIFLIIPPFLQIQINGLNQTEHK
jgi:hypothetical protein